MRRARAALIWLLLVAHLGMASGCASVPAASAVPPAATVEPPSSPPTSTTTAEHDPPAITEVRPERSQLAQLPPTRFLLRSQNGVNEVTDYRIGEEDEIAISVYGDEQLERAQIVRPGGKISFPFVGELMASGRTAGELSADVTSGLSRYIKDPKVTVIITKYNNRRVTVLGEVGRPGVLQLASDIDLLEGIARAGGFSTNADLRGAVLVRDGEIAPVDFLALFHHGDMSQDVILRRGDVILVPNIQDKKVFVLGEVNRPQTLPLRPGVTLLTAIGQSAGFTHEARKTHVVIVRGGFAHPTLITINIEKLAQGEGPGDLPLQPGDIVYVPKSIVANVVKLFQNITAILAPLVLAQSGIVLWPSVKAVFRGEAPSTPVAISPPLQ
jgi:polysaccharide export outer membrane protein